MVEQVDRDAKFILYILVIPAGRVPTSKNSDSSVACQKFVQSILELPATDEIHMEDRKKVWPELSPELIRPMAYAVRKAVINRQPSCATTATFESRTNKMKNVSEEKHNPGGGGGGYSLIWAI